MCFIIYFHLNFFPVNSICWAPHEYGLMLACGASDGAVSIISHVGKFQENVNVVCDRCSAYYDGKTLLNANFGGWCDILSIFLIIWSAYS